MTDFAKARALLHEFKGDSYLFDPVILVNSGAVVAATAKRAVLIRETFDGSDKFVRTIRRSLSDSGVDLIVEIKGAGPNCPREDLFHILEAAIDGDLAVIKNAPVGK